MVGGARAAWALLATVLALLAPAAGAAEAERSLAELFRERRFFTLRDRLEERGPDSLSPRERFYQAAVEQALNRPDDSNRTIAAALEAEELPADLEAGLHRLRMLNLLRLHRYAGALEAARAVLAAPPEATRGMRADVEQTARMLAALEDVGPQETLVEAPSRMLLGGDGRVPVEVEGGKVRLALDTGANLSVLRRSVARELGLQIRPAGVRVATAAGTTAAADLAVAARVRLGNVRYRRVAFLVFADELLTGAEGGELAGLVGFPLLEAAGEVRFRRDGVLEIPLDPPRRTLENLFLDGLDPVVRGRFAGEDLLCRLDTGAGTSSFYLPFFRRHQDLVTRSGVAVEVEVGGVGETRRVRAHRLPRITLTVAAAGLVLRQVEVFAEPLGPAAPDYLDCNLGPDAFRRFAMYAINFRDMALVVR